MEKTILYQRKISVKYSVDILVAGGGPAGVAAAVSAAGQGKKVMIVEQSGTFGGAGILACVPEFMNFDDGQNFLCKGFGEEVFKRLDLSMNYKRESYRIKPENLKRVYDALIEEAGVITLFYTRLTDVICEDGRVTQVILSGAEGSFAVETKFCIDATGCGMLCTFAGADFEYGDEKGIAMSATLCSLWGGIDFEKKDNDDGQMYQKAYEDGVFSQYDTVLPGIKANFPEIGVGEGNIGHCFNVDDTSSESLTEATFFSRKILEEYERYYNEYVPGCERAELIKSADFIGIRESRRIVCEYTLCREDYFKTESFPDEIGRYSYHVDMHPMSDDKKGMEEFSNFYSIHHGEGDSYSIPYRCLVPKKLKNVLVAGKSIGADRYMCASLRVIPGCFVTGHACGVAASVCVEDRTFAKDADIKKIQAIIG